MRMQTLVLEQRRLSPLLWVTLGICLLTSAESGATTWHVTYDPAQPEDRVGAVAAQAASGDSILIDPGTYYEHIPLEGKSLTFIGLAGSESTILDGSRTLPDREGSILYTLTGASADLTVSGITFTNATGAVIPGSSGMVRGGAIMWWEPGVAYTSQLTVIDCAFLHNRTGVGEHFWALGGGAIYAGALGSLHVERSSFFEDYSFNEGGEIYTTASSVEIAESEYRIGEGAYNRGACLYSEDGSLGIRQCTFESDAGDSPRNGIYNAYGDTEIVDCRFRDFGEPTATRIWLYCTCVGAPRQDVLMSGNVFWNASGADSAADPGVEFWLPAAAATLVGNTFVRCGVDIGSGVDGFPLTFENNIVARGQAIFQIPTGGSCSCNDFFRTTVTFRYEGVVQENNTPDNPLFCDEAGGDFTLSEGSPCAPSGECGLIGVEPVACDLNVRACCLGQECQMTTQEDCVALGGRWLSDPPVASCAPDPCVTPLSVPSWGRVKSMFR